MKNRSLFSTIAALAVIAFPATINFVSPTLAHGEINPADVVEFTSRDTNRLRGATVKVLMRNSPYVNVLPGGTFESGISDTQRISIQEQAVLNQSLVRPIFKPDKEICGETGEAAETGQKTYDYSISTNRGKGPLVCVKGMYSAFKTGYTAAEESLQRKLVQLNNADVRATLVDRSGCKLVVSKAESDAGGFEAIFNGEAQGIDTAFPNFLPDAAINFNLLEYAGELMREDLLVQPFSGKGDQGHLRFIGGQRIISSLRDEADIKQNHQYLAAGSYQIGKDTLTGYTWEGPYRGIAFGVDPQPLRFNRLITQDDIDAADGALDGLLNQPLYLEPEIGVSSDTGKAARTNPLWRRAKFEVALLMGMNSFTKLTPESFTGEGSFKFPPQMTTGQLKFEVIKDNDKNVWQDFGRHYYQFTRGYRPERPHAVLAIAFARKQADFGLTTISSFGDYSSSAAL